MSEDDRAAMEDEEEMNEREANDEFDELHNDLIELGIVQEVKLKA
jgi:hypothetical protein